MRFRITLRLLIVAVVLAGVIWLVEDHASSVREREGSPARLLPAGAEQIRYIMLDTAEGGRIDIGHGEDGVWALERPLEARANLVQVERLLSLLEALPRIETISGADMKKRGLTPASYGLDEPRGRVIVRDPLGRREILIGADAPLGGFTYVGFVGSDDVVATSRDVIELLNVRRDDVRDRAVLSGRASRPTRVEFQSAQSGFMQFSRPNGGWLIQQPHAWRADSAAIDAMLDALFRLTVVSFVEDSKSREKVDLDVPTGARLDPYGCSDAEAVARVKVWTDGGETGRELLFGNPVPEEEGLVFVKRRDLGSVYTVDRAILDMLPQRVDDVRDRRVFTCDASNVARIVLREGESKLVLQQDETRRWMILEPVQWKADQELVSRLVASLTGWHAAAFLYAPLPALDRVGLEPPRCGVDLTTRAALAEDVDPEHAGAGVQRLLLGTIPADGGPVHAMRAEEKWLFTISAAQVSALGKHPASNLMYYDRTMLALRPDDVQRVDVTHGRTVNSVVRSEDGWAVASGKGRVAQNVIDDILFFVANLRASEISEHNATDLAPYGLDQPSGRVTLGLAAAAGIQKTILIGDGAGEEMVYAMIQGQDVVFVMDKARVRKMFRSLYADDKE